MIDFIYLFAGLGGGIRIGFTQAANDLGLETRCVFTSEIKESALCALNHNFPGENTIASFTFLGKAENSTLRVGLEKSSSVNSLPSAACLPFSLFSRSAR